MGETADDDQDGVELPAGDALDPLTRYLGALSGGYRQVIDLALERLTRRRFGLPPMPWTRRLSRLLEEKATTAEAKARWVAADPSRRLPLKRVPAQFGLGFTPRRAASADAEFARRVEPFLSAHRKRDVRALVEFWGRLGEGSGWRDAGVRDLADLLVSAEYFIASDARAAGLRLKALQEERGVFEPAVWRLVLDRLAIAQVKAGDYAGARQSAAAIAALPPLRGAVDPRLVFADLFSKHAPAEALAALDAAAEAGERLPQSFLVLRTMLTLVEQGVEAAEPLAAGRPGLGPDALFAAYNVTLASDGGFVRAQAHLQAYFAHHGISHPVFARADRVDVNAIASDIAPEQSASGPLVTVIVTAFNAAATVEAALASLHHQTHAAIEIIVVDDLSGDGTRAIVERVAAADPRVRLLANRANIGTYLSRNRAMAQARGTYITFQDADDWSHPERIARHVALMEARPDIAVSKSQWVRMAADGSIPLRRWSRAFSHFNPSSLFIRAAALPQLGYFDAVRADADFEYARRTAVLFEAEAVDTIPIVLSIGFVGHASLTGSGATAINAEGYSEVRAAYKRAWVASYPARLRAGTMPLPALPSARGYAEPEEIAVDLTGVGDWFAEGSTPVTAATSGKPQFWFAISLISRAASPDWSRTVTVFRNTLRAIMAQDDPDFRVVVAGHDRPEIAEMADPRISFVVSDRPPAAKPSEFRADKMWKRRLIFHRIRMGGGGYVMPVDADDLVSRRLVSFVRSRPLGPGFVVMRGYALDWSARLLATVPGAWSVPFERVCGTSAIVHFTPEQLPLIHQNDVDDVAAALLGPHANWRLTAEEVGRPLEEIDWPACVYVVNTAVNLSFARQRAGGRAQKMLENLARARVQPDVGIIEEFALDEVFAQA